MVQAGPASDGSLPSGGTATVPQRRATTTTRASRARPRRPWRPLTSREFAVARLIGEGLTNEQIADALGIAPKTASAHVEHILAKLGAARRAEIATWASHVDGVAAVSH